jgi:hypothetical protein
LHSGIAKSADCRHVVVEKLQIPPFAMLHPIKNLASATVLAIAMMAFHLHGQSACVQEAFAEGMPCNGILEAGECMDSPVMQTHGNREWNPPADILSTYFLRDYVTAQVEGFKYMGSQQDAYLPWALPLSSHARVVGSELVTYRFNIEKRKIPIYKYKYDYVERKIYVREGGSTHIPSGGSASEENQQQRRVSPGKIVEKTVMEREIVSVKLVGYKTQEVRVYHPDGEFEEQFTVPIVKTQGVARLIHGWHAGNAQVAFAMLKGGLPATDPQFKMLLGSIHTALDAYGIPDHTYDVAWLTALYANLPKDDPKVQEWSGKLVSKLVAGAAQLGTHKGLWGPLCINPQYMNEIFDFDSKYTAKYITPLQQDLALEQRERSKERIQEKLTEKETLHQKWQTVYMTWAMSGNNASSCRAENTIPSETGGAQHFVFNSSAKIPGLVLDPFHFAFTDIESTCVALMALSEASAAGMIPQMTITPTDDRGKALAKPIDVKTQLATCYQTLKQLRHPTGGWDSCFSALHHKVCRDIPYTSIIPQDTFDKLPSADHWAYHVMGQMSLEYLARIIGGETGQRIKQETAQDQARLMETLLETLRDNALHNAPAKDNLVYFLADLIESRNPDARFLWQQVGVMLLNEPEDLARLEWMESHDSYAAQVALAAEHEFFKNAKLDPEVAQLEPSSNPFLQERVRLKRLKALGTRASTTYFLSKGIRQPVFAAVKPASNHGVCPALEYFINKRSEKMPLNYFYVSSAEAIAQYCTALFLLMEPKADTPMSTAEKNNFSKYIKNHFGTVVVLGLPGQGPALREKEIAAILDDAGLSFRKQESHKHGGRCIEYFAGERLVAVIVDASADKEIKQTYSKRLKMYQSLMEQKLPANYTKEDYGLLPELISNGELTMTGLEWEKE